MGVSQLTEQWPGVSYLWVSSRGGRLGGYWSRAWAALGAGGGGGVGGVLARNPGQESLFIINHRHS